MTAGYGVTAGGDTNSDVTAVLNLPLIADTLAVRGVIYDDTRGGYINNVPSTFTRKSTDLGIHYANYPAGCAATGTCEVPPPGGAAPINNSNTAGNAINPVTYKGLRVSAVWDINSEWNALLTQSYQSMDAQGVFTDVAPPPGSTASDPNTRNDNTAFFNDVQRGCRQTAFFTSVDFDLVPKVLTFTAGTRYYRFVNNEEGAVVGSFGCCIPGDLGTKLYCSPLARARAAGAPGGARCRAARCPGPTLLRAGRIEAHRGRGRRDAARYLARCAVGLRHHAHRPWGHDHAAVARNDGRGEARARSGESRPDHRRERDVSSGAVYKHHGPDRPGEPLPKDGYVMPRRLYGISKLASELITERYGDLFGLSTASVRPSSVYGTMDRVTASRNFRHVPNRIAHMALEGRGEVRVNTLDAVGDYIHVEDVTDAIIALLRAPRLNYAAYNVANGVTASVGDIVGWVAEKVPGFQPASARPGMVVAIAVGA